MTMTKIPASRGNRRAKKGDPASRRVADIIARVDAENAAKALADADTEIIAGMPGLFAALDGHGISVTRDPDFVSQDCKWCDTEPPRQTCVRVHGQPKGDDLHNPLELEETCTVCAPTAIRQARIEQDPESDHDIRVEVAH